MPTILRRAADAGAVLHDISKQVRLRLQPSDNQRCFILLMSVQQALQLEPLVNPDALRYLWAPSSSVAVPSSYFTALLRDTVEMAGERLKKLHLVV